MPQKSQKHNNEKLLGQILFKKIQKIKQTRNKKINKKYNSKTHNYFKISKKLQNRKSKIV